MMEVEDLSVEDCGEAAVWDFSSVTVINGNAVRRYLHPMDSLYIEILDGSLHKYHICGDTVTWHGFENPGTDMRASTAPVVMRFPFSYGDSLSESYLLKGRYYRSMHFIEWGDISVKADACGTMLTPDGDTLRNVIRLKETRTFHGYMSHRPLSDPTGLRTDTLPLQIQTRYRWYASFISLPIAEVIDKKVFKNHQLETSERKNFLAAVNINTLQHLRTSPQMIVKAKSQSGASPFLQGDANSPSSDIQAVTATEIGKTVSLKFNVVKQDIKLSIAVVDFSGRVYGRVEEVSYDAGWHSINFPMQELPNGGCMIVIVSNGDKDNPIKQIVTRR